MLTGIFLILVVSAITLIMVYLCMCVVEKILLKLEEYKGK